MNKYKNQKIAFGTIRTREMIYEHIIPHYIGLRECKESFAFAGLP